MNIGQGNFPILSPEQADPFLTGFERGQNIMSRGQQQQLTAQEIQKALLANQLQRAIQPSQIPAMIAKNTAITQTAVPMAQAGLTNQQLINQYYGPEKQSEINLRKAQIPLTQAEANLKQFQSKYPLLSLGGPAGQIGAIQYLQQMQPNQQNQPSNETQNYIDSIKKGLNSTINKNQAIANYQTARTTGLNYLSLPVQDKNTLNAYAAGMGIPADQAAKWFLSGKSLPELAQSKGLKLEDVTPIYNPNGSFLRQMQVRQAGVAEINSVADKVNDWIAPYSQTFAGYSPQQMMDSLKGENSDKQAKFWAARALTPELAAMRMRVLNGQVGIESIREISNLAYGQLRALPITRNPEIFSKAQRLVDKTINEAFDAATKATLKPYKNVPNISNNKGSNISNYSSASGQTI